MKKRVRLSESYINRIVKQTINESVGQSAEDLRGEFRRLLTSLEDLQSTMKRGDLRKMEESRGIVNHRVRQLENILHELKIKLRRQDS